MGRPGRSHLHHKPHFSASGSVSGSSGPLFATQLQILLLLLLSGNAVSQINEQKVIYFQENVDPPALIGNMTLPGDASDLTYTAISAGDTVDLPGNLKYSDLFDFQPGGDIFAKRRLDREQKSLYSVIVTTSAGNIRRMDIVIRDLNDNPPTFPEPIKNITVAENTRPDDQLSVLGSALDPDDGLNSTQRYEIISGSNGIFRLEETRIGNNDVSVILKLNGTLDYESQKRYSLIVRAYDGAGRHGDLRVYVAVTDVNDLVPTFDHSLYSADVFENASIGQVVLTVSASDEEEGNNGVVEYALSPEDSSPHYTHFAVDGRTGEISVRHALNYNTQSTYRLRVVARNPGTTAQSSSAVVNIQIVNINDQAPEITVDYLQTREISENLTVPMNIIRLSVDDPDQQGGNFTVSLSDTGGAFRLSRRDSDTFFIVLSSPLDRENVDLYNISVTAWDNGSPPLSKTIAVEIRVGDVNDNSPAFAELSYTLEVEEGARMGSPIGNVTASDSDIGDNSLLTYSLEAFPGGKSDWFTVHNASGMVMTARDSIVCEANSPPKFYIRATDNGVPSRSSRVLVTVAVRDLNDNAPIFDQSFYAASVSENEDSGKVLLQVTATDSDCGSNSEVTYSLNAGGVTPPTLFSINPTSGFISLVSKLDFEAQQLYEFPVMALDRGGQVASVNVKVNVNDANDNQPIFSPQSYAGNVRLDSSVGETIIVVKATDADSGVLGNVSYFLSNGDGANHFRIDQLSGEIKLNRVLPSPPPDSYQLTITAQDGLNSPALVPANVTIIVVRDSDQAPLFTEALYRHSIDENSSEDTLVGRVRAQVQSDSSGIVYSIFSGDMFSYFYIDSQGGQIKTTAIRADRERFDFIILNVRAEKNGVYGNAQVNITINDVNDNRPRFTSSLAVVLPVREDASNDSTLYTVAAADLDSGPNGRVRYRLAIANQMFSINQTSGALSLRNSLDFETRRNYTLHVEAYDSGTPQLNNTLDITVSVQDVNDNPPIFNPSQYDLSLSELSPPLTEFGPVYATDADSGQNGKIYYHIQENQTSFGIFPSSGKLYNEISFSQMERRQSYTLHIVATDGGAPSLSATSTVRISIEDENDNIPRFSQSVFQLTVQEDALPGQEIGAVSATDNDAGDNAQLSFTLPRDVTSFRINRNNGNIYVKAAIDRETNPIFEFSVNVADSGTPAQTAAAVVRVTVTDINDNAPIFNNIENGVIPAYVYENKDNTTMIVQVTAVDPDEGDNQRVSYSIVGDQSANFAIDRLSGWIRARVTFDREVKSVYNVTVVARDHGSSPRAMSSSVTVMVRVLDKNEPPRFTASYLEIETMENIPLGTVIGRVLAQDGDQGENGQVHYTIKQSNLENVFDVNMTSGEIYSALPVDHEKIAFHWLIVQAVDSSLDDPQATNINVTITVIDKNDNVPTFLRDPKWINIVENTTVGDPIGQVTAYDGDSGQNGEVIYEIVSQFPAGVQQRMFNINPKTGQISTATTIDYEITPGVLLVIKATDQAVNVTQRRHSTCSVVINIEDINDNFPQFKSRNVISIAEDESVGYPIVLVAATDADRNNSIRYTIQSGDPENKFYLNGDSGELKLNGILDRETQAKYNLSVKAIDTGNPPKFATQNIYITVTDVNDNPPQFSNKTYTASVAEQQSERQRVVTVVATDRDEGANAELEYMIPAGLADNLFSIDPNGVIRTTAPLDRETKSIYTFSAYVHDNAYPKLYDWCTVTVHVTDINDHSPYFLHTEFFQTVPENLRDRNSSIFQVIAQDGDEGDNALISYSITVGNEDNKFSVDPHTGKIYAKRLDREQRERYTLTVRATDNGSPSRSGETRVIITISDTNDNDPVFTNSGANYQASLNETIAPGSFVLAISATDLDKGNNSRITYYISSNGTDGTEGKFHLNMETGVITTSPTAGHFDREKKSFYSFRVTAQDNAQYDPRTKQTWVEITILDINDNAPVFDQVPYQRNISRDTPPETAILTIHAGDKDEPNTRNSEVEYSITEGGEYFKVVQDTGVIKVKQNLLGVVGIQKLKVRAVDKGTPPLSSDGYVEIRVGSSGGQQTFKFPSSSYQVAIDEDVNTGAYVMNVSATHTDRSMNDEVTYSITGDVAENNNPFTIEPLTGKIHVADSSKLNYEDVQRYRIVVVAVSRGFTDYCTVWINVRDKNDNAPTFPHDRYPGFVFESANVSTYILQVVATDKDGTQANKEISYRLQGEKAHYLHIGPKTGIIRLAEQVDRETNEQIRVTIIAQDSGSPSLSGTTILRLTIRDANDNPPTFTNLREHQADTPVMVKEDLQVGQEVYVVSALDPDTGPDVTFDFALSGNPDEMFSIDHITGRITLARELDHELVNSYILRLIVNDSVTVVNGDLYVRVTDENDNTPRFAHSTYEIWIEELMPVNSPVIQVTATDSDSGRNGRIKYSLQGAGADDFYINETSGWIYNSRRISYSTDKAIMNLAVRAADGGEPELNALVFVQIHIKDVNNYAPVFSTTQSFTGLVSEDEAIGMTVLSLSASDADDSPDNKRIEFSIVDGDPNGQFSMQNQESNLGHIVLTKVLDRETRDNYQLVIMAADDGTPSRNTTTTVNITVSDFNDWPPVFSNADLIMDTDSFIPTIIASVSEDIDPGSVIVQVEATDKDIGDNAHIEFMITSGNDDGLFQMDQQNGIIRLAEGKILDYDIKQEHRMQVRAADTGVPRQSALATVLVNVSDVNDNKPRFTRLMYLETVKEQQPYGTEVFTAQAVDVDAGIYGNLTYALVGADAPNFKIDPVSGRVITAIVFSYAGKKTYMFNVTATDLGGLRAVVQVQVQVLRFDQHKPSFTQSVYKFEIGGDLSKTYVGMEIGRVRAIDQDIGIHGGIVYTLLNDSYYFNVSRDEGIIAIKNSLTEDEKSSPKAKRDLSSHLTRHKRSLNREERLSIKAWSGRPGSQSSVVEVVIVIPGVGGTTSPTTQVDSRSSHQQRWSGDEADGPTTRDLIIIIVVVCLAVIVLVVVLVVKTLRNRRNTKREPHAVLTQPENMDSLGRVDTYGRVLPAGMAPPPYGVYPQYATASHDMTDRSQCASSGRGSAEFDDEGDEEITAINTVPLHVHQRAKMMPDSGIQRDADTISEHSARDHQEYLARLGIDPRKIGTGEKKGIHQSVESMHQFSDEGGGEADPLDISNLYNKLGDDGGLGDEAGGENNINQMGFGEAPAQIGSLSSVTDASEEFTGSYNWDYLLNWGPQFQPLADVFAEIARLKDETIQPKRKPVQTIPQTGSIRTQPPIKLGGPPPIITATPPRVDSYSQRTGGGGHHELAALSSARTSQLTSMVSLPHSPISHESSFSNLAFSPNFTPALSPLATRSPSVSTLQSNGSRSRSGQGSRSGHQGHHNHLGKPSSVTMGDSDLEYRI